MDDNKLGIVRVNIKPLNFSGKLVADVYLNGKVYNSDSNYDELFWNHENSSCENRKGYVSTSTKRHFFINQPPWSIKLNVMKKSWKLNLKL